MRWFGSRWPGLRRRGAAGTGDASDHGGKPPPDESRLSLSVLSARDLASGLGVAALIVVLAVGAALSVLHIDAAAMFTNTSAKEQRARDRARNVEARKFVATLLEESDQAWRTAFGASGQDYPEPQLQLFEKHVSTACGTASLETGPYYCPKDGRIYVDLDFYRTLHHTLGSGGDLAQAYVLAHEIAHHVQNVTGVLKRFETAERSLSEAEKSRWETRLELQADCYAGVWAHFTHKEGLLDVADLPSALADPRHPVTQIAHDHDGPDIAPETFDHATAKQRAAWFSRGLKDGWMADCNAFAEQS